MSNSSVEKIIKARVDLIFNSPFFGNMALRLKLVESNDWCKTCSTDGRNLYYNDEFVQKLTPPELKFVVCHEVLHNCYDHLARWGNRNKKLANIAADYVVNYDIVEQNIGKMPAICLYDKKYAGMTFEQVYELLKDEVESNINKLSGMVLDEHLDGSGDDGQPQLSEAERREIQNEVREAMLSAIESAGAGNVPGNLKRMIDEFLSPKIDWREMLEQQILSLRKEDFSWTRPSRRGWHSDGILPGMIPGQQVSVSIAIDTSGSISRQDLTVFLSEVKGIFDSFTEYRADIWCFDTSVHNHQVYSHDSGEDLINYEPGGGGGTSFDCNWSWMKENEIEPQRLIVFTDMEPYGGWGDPDYCETIWIAYKSNKVAPFGTTVKYTE